MSDIRLSPHAKLHATLSVFNLKRNRADVELEAWINAFGQSIPVFRLRNPIQFGPGGRPDTRCVCSLLVELCVRTRWSAEQYCVTIQTVRCKPSLSTTTAGFTTTERQTTTPAYVETTTEIDRDSYIHFHFRWFLICIRTRRSINRIHKRTERQEDRTKLRNYTK